MESDVKVETYVDNAKKENINSGNSNNNGNNSSSGNKDTTVANGKIPQTGVTSVICIILIFALIGGFCYFKYYKLRDVR